MIIENEGAAAFPTNHMGGQDGLTKKEYISALALQGLLANPNNGYKVAEDRTNEENEEKRLGHLYSLASDADFAAFALIDLMQPEEIK